MTTTIFETRIFNNPGKLFFIGSFSTEAAALAYLNKFNGIRSNKNKWHGYVAKMELQGGKFNPVAILHRWECNPATAQILEMAI